MAGLATPRQVTLRPWFAVFASKPDNTWRICYDYRGLNAITRKAIEPIPHIEALLDATRGAAFFTKLDLASAYNQFRVREEDRWKTMFRCPLGQYEWIAILSRPASFHSLSDNPTQG